MNAKIISDNSYLYPTRSDYAKDRGGVAAGAAPRHQINKARK